MTVAEINPDAGDDGEDEVDLDLDDAGTDEALRAEAIGKPVRVRLGGEVFTIPHNKAWPYEATNAYLRGDFTTWAHEVLAEADLKVWLANIATLKNYRVEAIVDRVNKNAGVTMGKSPRSGSSSKRKARR